MADPNFDPDAFQRFDPRPPSAMRNMAAELPTVRRLVRGADGVLRAAGSFGAKAASATMSALPYAGAALAVGGEAMGVADVANDPNTTKADVATRVAEGAGRLGAMGAGAGLGAAGGSVFGPVGTAIGGALGGTVGYFAPNAVYAARDWWLNRGTKPAAAAPAAPAAPAQSVAAPGAIDAAKSGANNGMTTDRFGNIMFAGPNGPEYGVEGPGGFTGMVRDDQGMRPASGFDRNGVLSRAEHDAAVRGIGPAGGAIPRSGMGTVQVGRGAPTLVESAPTATATTEQDIANRTGYTRNGLPNIGGFFGATARLRQIAQDNALKAAAARAEIQYGGTSEWRRAQAENELLRTQAAREHLRQHPGDFAGAAAVAAGRTLPTDQYTFIPTMDQNKVDVGNKRSGGIERVAVQPRATEADIQASMKAHKMTREQVLAEYRRRGIQVGGFGATQ